MVHSYTQLSQLWLPSLSWFSPLHSRLPAFHISSPPPLLFQDAALKLKLESVDVSTTPPLTPASIPPSPAVTTSEEPGKNSSSFFADTYYDDGGSTSSNISISTSTHTITASNNTITNTNTTLSPIPKALVEYNSMRFRSWKARAGARIKAKKTTYLLKTRLQPPL